MLVLKRKLDEQIKIGDDITITLTHIGVRAPKELRIDRKEIYDKIKTGRNPSGGGS